MDTSSDSVSGSSSSNRGSSSSATGSDSSNSSLIVSSSSFKESSSSSILENTDVSSSSEISSSSVHSSSSVEIEQSSSSIADTCNGVEYDNLNEFCFEDGIYEKCNDKIYNPTKHKCDESNSILQNHCNGTLYDTYLEYCINGILKNKGELIDDRDQKTYKTVDIGTQTWMAENLNYNANGSLCYNDDSNNCVIYGRLYNWTTAMANSESSSENPSGIRGICPSGWHLPSKAELEQLIDYVGGIEAAETKLKANSGLWRYNAGTNVSTLDNYNIGTDDYGFSALPGGFGGIAFGFDGGVFPEYWYRGSDIRWWSSTKHPTYNNEACFLRIGSVFWTGIRYERVLYWHSIRCVKD
ncbi:MAG: hypothetical protein FWB90_08685 [Fibromonadales bacterium]|nr:hypothetical protein [Fibromonadales bacterium]